ncbi:MAG: SDR family NAD(P)-dependent oxidoreductase [Bacteroidia bacterium]|nr:SDR family NAD(P)-dependent oxidoreductase [Bacteroidia bacterium]
MNSEQVVIVTGAFSGIGLMTTELLMKSKNKVVAVGRNQQNIFPSFKTNFLPIARNLHSQRDAQDVVEFALERFGRIDAVIHAAGKGLFKPSMEQTQPDFERMFADNFYGAALLSQAILPYFVQNKSGTQVFLLPILSSDSARLYGAAHYSAKMALSGYIESIRYEAQKHLIKLSVLEVAQTQTSFWGELKQPFVNQPFFSRLDVAKAILSVVTQPTTLTFNHLVLYPNTENSLPK